MATPQCPLCGCTRTEFVFTEKTYELLTCDNCDLFFIHPYPSADETHSKVPEYSYSDHEIGSAAVHYESSKHFYEKYYPPIREECQGAESILDVGCGTGRLLELLKGDFDARRIGIEFNNQRAELAREVASCEILQTPIEEFRSEEKFDVVILINVLSHISSFDGLFHSVRGLLSGHGKLILKVGEMKRHVNQNAVFDWEIPDHLHFLGIRTIEHICEKYKFRIVRHDRELFSSDLFSKYRWRMPGRSITRNFAKSIVAHTPLALNVLRSFYVKKYGENIYTSFIVLTPVE